MLTPMFVPAINAQSLQIAHYRWLGEGKLSENIYGEADTHDSNAIEILVGRVRR